MTPDWNKLDPGTEKLALIGPARIQPLPALDMPQLAIDGGSRFAVRPLLWAGDGDSGKAPTGVPAFNKLSQDMTDLRFCLDHIHAWRWRELHLFGFLGGRRDHELANFGEIHAAMKARPAFVKAVFHGEDNTAAVLFLNAGAHTLELYGTFSTLVLEPASVTISGDCHYSREKVSLHPLSGHGVSNEASGTVNISSTAPVMILERM
jgi:thiamine pyrophosphokinase